MLDDMISAKALIDWLPAGRHYKSEFERSLPNSSRLIESESWLSRGFNAGYRELYLCGRTIVSSDTSEIFNKFPDVVLHTSTPVLRSFFASFLIPSLISSEGVSSDEESTSERSFQRGIVVLEAERLTFLDSDGETYVARLPCRAATGWPMDSGVLIERQTHLDEITSKVVGPPCSSSLHMFTLFSLSHPLDEAAPVLLKVPLPSGEFGVCFVSDVNLKIVQVFSELKMVLTCHQETGLHSLWAIQTAVAEDYIHLYELNEDGRACVGTWALNRPYSEAHMDEERIVPVHIISTPSEIRSPYQIPSTTPSIPNIVLPQYQSKLCLSPFAASLSKLVSQSKTRRQSVLFGSPFTRGGSPISGCPMTPANLTTHIDRLSSVAPTRVGVDPTQQSSRRGSVLSSAFKSTPCHTHQNNRSALLHSSLGLNFTPNALRSLHTNRAANQSATAPGASCSLNVDHADELSDEPLLPKICLQLIWTQSVTASGAECQSPLKTKSRPFQSLTSARGLHSSCCSLDPTLNVINHKDTNESRPSSQLILTNKRLMDLSQAVTPSMVRTKGQTSRLSVPSGSPYSIPVGAKQCTSESVAFLATDMVQIQWVCFLVSTSSATNVPVSHLACIETRSLLQKHPSATRNLSTAPAVTYLPATSAVYIPHNRLTACVDPTINSIMLYTGVTRVCLLGIGPPPLSGAYSAIASPRFVLCQRRLRGSSFRLPFVVRPSHTDLDQWNVNTVPGLLDRVNSTVTALLSEWETEENMPSLSYKKPDLSRIQSSIALLGAESATDSSNCSTAPINESSSLSDAAGNAFTLTLVHKIPDCDNRADNRKFLRVHLPALTENELVNRCLIALERNLPHAVSLRLLTRWYATVNAPGTSWSMRALGTSEWVRFAHFLLEICGFQLLDDDDDVTMLTAAPGALPNVHSTSVTSHYIHDAKRHCSTTDTVTDSHWEDLRRTVNLATITDASLFGAPFGTGFTNLSRLIPNGLSTTYRSDSASREILVHLPTILLSLHLVYEDAKLNTLLTGQLQCMGELNLLLSRILDLPAFVDYYVKELPGETLHLAGLPSWDPPVPTLVQYPVSFSTDSVPCLYNWLNKRLATPWDQPVGPYIYLSGVNDLAVTLAGMTLAGLYAERSDSWCTDVSEFLQDALTWWRSNLTCFAVPVETSTTASFTSEELRTVLSETVPSDSLDQYALAFAETLLLTTKLAKVATDRRDKVSASKDFLAPHNFAVIFLSTLDKFLLAQSKGSLFKQLNALPSGFSTILRLILNRSSANPPPNCASSVYHLMGREDLARLNELAPTVAHNHESNYGGLNKNNSVMSCPEKQARALYKDCFDGVKSLRESTSQQPRSVYHITKRHPLLAHLENTPSVQAAFKDDLRLREAYRLLQSHSHIRLPRLNSIDNAPGLSPSAEAAIEPGSRLIEPRLEMHLAAAGIRVWASLVGRGMLGLGTLYGSRLSTRLRVAPVCLRGRAMSPSSGRRVFVDLARESLPSTSANLARPGGTLDGAAGLMLGDTGTTTDRARTGTAAGAEVSAALGTENVDASDNPGNAMALAIASAVAANGIGTALKTASLDLPHMVPRGNLSHQNLAAIANNSASATASLLSTASLQQIPAVLASKHWPDFHNGVAVGLSVAPHASVDATWIMYNCRSVNASASVRPGTGPIQPSDLPSAEQAGLLLGLGLNGHLNKLTPYDIGEYLVRVHDMHNMAVLLGLCAGKRGTMDQSVLRLLAVHYKPLLPSDPLVHLQLSVPSLCQAAAVFGLGLLYEGSAHRHITNLLLTELGRPLSGPLSNAGRSSFQLDPDPSASGTNASNTASPVVTTNGWTGAAGSGGFAGDSGELIALSAGLALGLVLLKRADSPCGLSDIPWAEKLHAYMTGAPRCTESQTSAPKRQNMMDVISDNFTRKHLQSVSPSVRTSLPRRYLTRQTSRTQDDAAEQRPTQAEASRLSHQLLNFHDLLNPYDTDPFLQSPESDTVLNPSDSRILNSPLRSGRHSSSGEERLEFSGRPNDRRMHQDFKGLSGQAGNPKIRELECYNTDVSGPGAIMALGMAYLGSGNATISEWLAPPSSLVQLESIRPDFFMFRALAHGLVNWTSVEPTMDWITAAFCPPLLLQRLGRIKSAKPTTTASTQDAPEPPAESALSQASSEDDVENRCPDVLPSSVQYPIRRSDSSSTVARPTPLRLPSTRRGSRSRRREVQTNRGRSGTFQHSQSSWPSSSLLTPKMARNLRQWQSQFSSESASQADHEALSLVYLNILVGRAFVLGLRFAGTCFPAVAQLLLDLVHSLLDGSWWPPCRDRSQNAKVQFSKCPLPQPAMESAVAHCLLSLSMVLAGSGDVAVLRLIRQLRAIRLFHQTTVADSNRAKTNPTMSFTNQPRLYTVASIAARAAAAASQTSSTTSASSGGPVSVAGVFGATLGQSFGIHLVYGLAIGLLFLGGGRLTLSNTPEAAAILSIAFLPILPTHSGDNWYHLQALRHLYVLATRPRRLCAVDVDTNHITLSNMLAKFQHKNEYVSSRDTLIFPTNSLDDLTWIELNHASDDYWPTIFYNGTQNWNLLRAALQNTGYIFVKRRQITRDLELIESWLSEENVNERAMNPDVFTQLKLVSSFLRRFSPSDLDSSSSCAVQLITASVTQLFFQNKDALSASLKDYYLRLLPDRCSQSTRLRDTFRSWFDLPTSTKLHPQIIQAGENPSLPFFLQVLRPACPVTMPDSSLLWLYSFLYRVDNVPMATTQSLW